MTNSFIIRFFHNVRSLIKEDNRASYDAFWQIWGKISDFTGKHKTIQNVFFNIQHFSSYHKPYTPLLYETEVSQVQLSLNFQVTSSHLIFHYLRKLSYFIVLSGLKFGDVTKNDYLRIVNTKTSIRWHL